MSTTGRMASAAAAALLMSLGAGAQAKPGAVETPVHRVATADAPSPGIDPTTDTMRDPAAPAGPNPVPFGSTEPVPANGLAAPTAQASGTALPRYRLGAAVLVGGGYEDFVNNNLRGMTGGGGAWNARLVSGLRQTMGVEAAYVGSARSIDGVGLGSNATLMSNGVEGLARGNVPIELGERSVLEPFVFLGLGWQHYRLRGTDNTGLATVGSSDDVLTVPVGAGLEFGYGMLIADARFTYRQTYLNDLLRANGGGRLSTWGATAQVGIEF